MSSNDPKPPTESELAWGIHPVVELLRTNPQQVREVVIQKGKAGPKIQEIVTLARQHGIKLRFDPFFRVPPEVKNENHQGVLARLGAKPLLHLDELLAGLAGQAAPVLVVLDSIQDPHNLGAIIRSASAAGAAGVILTKDRSAPLTGTVGKAAAGALAHVPLCQVTNMATALARLKEEGFWIYGAAGEAAQSLFATDFGRGPVCLVIGSEGKGIRPLVRKQCDLLVSIPMQSP
ncbi:MAG: 23S rRNA (guanosine(2251)-2'-O)-methyltransferase RlmB, partial [Desulfobacteraceae bacterium]|nr:23S rRNA (guanosine(2251)-2'-O)-methyltransferase RlmB [Desulfobacteraceae bacterium]